MTVKNTLNIDQMFLIVFDSLDTMTFIRTEVCKDDIPQILQRS